MCQLAFQIGRKIIHTPSIIDIEASGFGVLSYPIEVGVVRQDGARFCRLIKPFDDWYFWDNSAQKVHGISQAILNRNGYDGIKVCHELNHFLENSVVYTDGWVVDSPWLIKLFERAKVNMSFKVSSLEMILKEQQMNTWHTTKDQVVNTLNLERHRASNDALIVQRTFELTARS